MWKIQITKLKSRVIKYMCYYNQSTIKLSDSQTERFSVMAKGSDYFLSLYDKSRQSYKVKINIVKKDKKWRAFRRY